jgi:hypothetical protein
VLISRTPPIAAFETAAMGARLAVRMLAGEDIPLPENDASSSRSARDHPQDQRSRPRPGRHHGRAALPPETGGVLLGHFHSGEPIVTMAAEVPDPRTTRIRYRRDADSAAAIATDTPACSATSGCGTPIRCLSVRVPPTPSHVRARRRRRARHYAPRPGPRPERLENARAPSRRGRYRCAPSPSARLRYDRDD